MITVKGLNKSFGKMKVLNDLSFAVRPGAVTAFLGPNASGKSTLIKCVLGLVKPDSGRILVDGESIAGRWDYRTQIGYMPQITRFPDNLKVEEVLRMLTDMRKPEDPVDDELIDAFGLSLVMDRRLGVLSGGTRQKINAAIAFMFDPDILILDEPTAGLDPLSIAILNDKIEFERENGKTICLTSHNMHEVDELAQHIVFLLDGRIHFDGDVLVLKQQTGESKLESAIVSLMENGPMSDTAPGTITPISAGAKKSTKDKKNKKGTEPTDQTGGEHDGSAETDSLV